MKNSAQKTSYSSLGVMAFVLSLGGFTFGYLSPSAQGFDWVAVVDVFERFPSEDKAAECMSKNEAQKLIVKYKATFNLENWDCSENDTRTHFLRALGLAQKMSYEPDKNWDPAFRKAVMNLETWLTRYAKSYNIDSEMSDTTLAYYDPKVNKTFMTGRIREYTPLEVFSVIVHENFHAQTPGLNHAFCVSGDFPQQDGACDNSFSDKLSSMGSYNFTALFELGSVLFNRKLTPVERDQLTVSVLETLSTRFNEMPEGFGNFHETLAVLDDQQKPYILDPFTLELESPKGLYKEGEDKNGISREQKIDHIENSELPMRFSLFTEDGKWAAWHPISGVMNPYSKALDGKFVVDSRRSVVFTYGQIADTIIIGGTPFYMITDVVNKKKVIKEFYQTSMDQVRTDLKRLVFGGERQSIFLTQDGSVLMSRRYGNEKNFQTIPSDRRWIQGTTGALYDQFYFTSEDGVVAQLKSTEISYSSHDADDDYPAESQPQYDLEPVASLSHLKVRKYYPGLNAEYALDQSGNLWLKARGSQDFKKIRINKGLKDFAVIKAFGLNHSYLKLNLTAQEEFKKTCGVKNSLIDPWLQQPVGLDQQGRILRLGLDGQCVKRSASTGPVESFSFASEKVGAEKSSSIPVLMVKTSTGSKSFKPYEE